MTNKIMMLEKLPKRPTERQNELRWHLTIKAVKVREMRSTKLSLRRPARFLRVNKSTKRENVNLWKMMAWKGMGLDKASMEST